MKRLMYLLFFMPCIAMAQLEGSKQTFESPKLKSAISAHKIVAILPFDVTISYRKQPKGFSPEGNRDQEQKCQNLYRGACLLTFLERVQITA